MNAALQNVLSRVAPRLPFAVWDAPLEAAFEKFEWDTPRRQAASIGQCLVEATATFGSTIESLYYTSADRLTEIFGSHFPDPASAAPYVRNPEALANFVYANKEGNGDVASGDGWRYRGRGLIQITFKDSYAQLAEAIGMDLSSVTAWCETPAGAAMSAIWFLQTNGCRPLADAWDISMITRKVAGPGMGFLAQRLRYSNYILQALEAAE